MCLFKDFEPLNEKQHLILQKLIRRRSSEKNYINWFALPLKSDFKTNLILAEFHIKLQKAQSFGKPTTLTLMNFS